MDRVLISSLAALCLVAGCSSAPHASDRTTKEAMSSEDAQPMPHTNMRIVMQAKTTWAAALLESVATRDYERIESNARALHTLSLESGFLAQDTLSYRTLAEEFRREILLLATQARERDQASVEESYQRVTAACFRCHSYVSSERFESAMPGRSGM